MSHHSTSPRSGKAGKALVAGTVGIALLAAGGGTFALWSETQQAGSGTITSGELRLASTGPGAWDQDLTTFRAVPGDTLTYTDTLTITATGTTLDATLDAAFASTTLPEGTTLDDYLTTTFTVDGQPASGPVLVVEDGTVKPGYETVDVTVTVAFDDVDGIEAQNLSAELETLDIVLAQTDTSVAP